MQQTISRVAWIVGITTIVLAGLRFIWNLWDASRIGIGELSGRDWMALLTNMSGLAVTGLFAMGKCVFQLAGDNLRARRIRHGRGLGTGDWPVLDERASGRHGSQASLTQPTNM